MCSVVTSCAPTSAACHASEWWKETSRLPPSITRAGWWTAGKPGPRQPQVHTGTLNIWICWFVLPPSVLHLCSVFYPSPLAAAATSSWTMRPTSVTWRMALPAGRRWCALTASVCPSSHSTWALARADLMDRCARPTGWVNRPVRFKTDVRCVVNDWQHEMIRLLQK